MHPHRRMRAVSLALLTTLVLSVTIALPVSAGPRGDARDSDVGDLLHRFKVTALAAGDAAPNRGCTNDIYLRQGEPATIRWFLDSALTSSFEAQDCDGTDGSAAIWATEAQQYYVMVNLRRPRAASLNLVCVDLVDYFGLDDLCLDSSLNLPLGFTRKIVLNIPEGQAEEVFWTISGAWEVFDILIYEKLQA